MDDKMKRLILAILAYAICLAGMPQAYAEPEVIWWQITDSAIVGTPAGDVSISEFGEAYGAEFARIKTSDGSYLLTPYGNFDTSPGNYIDIIDIVDKSVDSVIAFAYLPANPAELLFMVEIGNWDSDDNWTSEASSRSYSYQELIAHIMSDWDSASHAGSAIPWTPDAFVVPEPDSMMLISIGTMFLMLKRPKNVYFIYEHTRS